MLTYLISVTDRLLILSILTGVAISFAGAFYLERGKLIVKIGLVAGLLAAIVRAIITNSVRIKASWTYSSVYYGIVIGLFIVAAILAILSALPLIKKRAKLKTAFDIAIPSVIAAVLLLLAFIFLPTVYAYPFKFDAGESVLSTDFLFRLAGWALGIIVCVCAGVASYKLSEQAAAKGLKGMVAVIFTGVSVIELIYVLARQMTLLAPRRIVKSQFLFNFASGSGNHEYLYTYFALGLLAVFAIILIVKGVTQNEPYKNPAERRKIRASWRNAYRQVAVLTVCAVVGVLCLTWFVALNTTVIAEVPVEECEVISAVFGGDRFMSFEVSSEEDISSATMVTVNGKNWKGVTTKSGENKYILNTFVGNTELDVYDMVWYSGSAEMFSASYKKAAEEGETSVKLIKTYSEKEDCLYVPIDIVSDGHLHRFGYTTERGFKTRFIVIRKPNSSLYGVGLDACDICGEAGYYERNDQIVCKKCDVVMNVNTIGFKGGCNPIVIDYTVDYENGYVIVPTAALILNEEEFK